MDAESIRELLHKQPFEPFEIVMSSGEVHQVKHPEFAIVSPSRVVVVDPATEKLSILSRVHITEVRMPQAV
jgi:hypothetical protein